MTAKRGRPPLADGKGRDVLFTIRLTRAERAAIAKAAASTGKPETRWARDTLVTLATVQSKIETFLGSASTWAALAAKQSGKSKLAAEERKAVENSE
jgi:hypothetical protein